MLAEPWTKNWRKVIYSKENWHKSQKIILENKLSYLLGTFVADQFMLMGIDRWHIDVKWNENVKMFSISILTEWECCLRATVDCGECAQFWLLQKFNNMGFDFSYNRIGRKLLCVRAKIKKRKRNHNSTGETFVISTWPPTYIDRHWPGSTIVAFFPHLEQMIGSVSGVPG